MAEAVAVVGLLASIGSLIDLSVKIVSRINDFAAHSCDIPKSFRSLANRLPLLSQTLRRIQARAQAGQLKDEVAKDLDNLVNDITGQVRLLEDSLNRIIPPADASRLEKKIKGLQSLAKDEKIKKAVEKIHRDIDVLLLHLTTDNAELSDSILEKVSQLSIKAPDVQQTYGLCLGRAPQLEPSAFVGRTTELQQLHDWLAPEEDAQAQCIVSIVGMGGLGKTQLSLTYARQHAACYSSVFWVNARDEQCLRQSLSALSNVIFPNDTTVVESVEEQNKQLQKVLRWLSEPWNNRWLILFDNYDDPALPNITSPTGFDIRSFFPSRTQGSIIITTRSPKLTFTQRLILQKLNGADLGVAILSHRSGRDMSTDADARALASRLDGLPLALATAGTYLGQTGASCAEYLEAYCSAWSDLHGCESEPLLEYEDRTLSSTWTVSFNQVSKQDADAAELLKLFAFLGNQDIWYELIRAGGKSGPMWLDRVTTTKIRFNKAMTKLRDYSLVELTSGSYHIHPCLHDWILEHLHVPLTTSWFVTAMGCVVGTLLSGYLTSLAMKPNSLFWETGRRLLEHINRLNLERFQAIWEASPLNGLMFFAGHLFGEVHWAMGQLGEAEATYGRLQAAIERELGEEGEFWTSQTLGMIYRLRGKPKKAEQMLSRTVTSMEKRLGRDHAETLGAIHSLAVLYTEQGKLDEAEQMYLRILAGNEPESPYTSKRAALTNLANIYSQQGRLEEAEPMYLRALAEREKAFGKHHWWTLVAVRNLGQAYSQRGKSNDAEQMYQQALAGFDKIFESDYDTMIDEVDDLGFISFDEWKLDGTEQMYLRAIPLKERVLELCITMIVDIAYRLGKLYETQGSITEAEQVYLRIFTSFEDAIKVDRRLTLESMFRLGDLYFGQKRWEEAEKIYARAFSSYQDNVAGSPPEDATRKFAAAICMNITECSDSFQSQRIRIASLIKHVKLWNKIDRILIVWLTEILGRLGDMENGATAIHFAAPDEVKFREGSCRVCCKKLNIHTGFHCCKISSDIALCSSCLSLVTKAQPPATRVGDAFFNLFPPSFQAFGLTGHKRQVMLEAWMDKLAKQYAVSAET